MNKQETKILLQETLKRINQQSDGDLRLVCMERWKRSMQQWLDGDYDLVEHNLMKVSARIENTRELNSSYALMRELYGDLAPSATNVTELRN